MKIRVKKVLSVAVGYNVLLFVIRSFRRLLWNDSAQWGYDNTVGAVKRLTEKGKEKREKETFSQAVERLGLTEKDILEKRTALMDQATIFRWLGHASVIATLVSGYFTDGIWWFALVIINGLSISFMFFAFAFVRTFRSWQIDKRELAPLRQFLDDGGVVRTLLG